METSYILLAQQDLQQVQFIQGAIRSGIYALLEAVGLQVAEVQRGNCTWAVCCLSQNR